MPMDIVLVRVDNRLIHGQILEAWVPFVKAACIVVVDDEVAGDLFRVTVMRMAVPREVEVIVCGVEEFTQQYSYGTGSGKKAIVLFATIADAVKAYCAGFKFTKLNLGNVHNAQGDKDLQYSTCVFLNETDLGNLRSLLNTAAVQIELQRVPQETPVNAQSIVQA